MSKIDGNTQSAMKRVEQVLAKREQIREAISTALAAQPGAEINFQKAEEAYGEALAAAAMRGEVNLGPSESSAAVIQAQLCVNGLKACLQGLERQLAENGSELLEAVEDLDQAHAVVAEAQIEAFVNKELVPAAAAWNAVLRRGAALADAIDNTWLTAHWHDIRMEHPLLKEAPPILDMSKGGPPAFGCVWEGDARAESLHAEFAKLKEVRKRAAMQAQEVRRCVEEARRTEDYHRQFAGNKASSQEILPSSQQVLPNATMDDYPETARMRELAANHRPLDRGEAMERV